MCPTWQDILANVCKGFVDNILRRIKTVLDVQLYTESIDKQQALESVKSQG